uniref:Uncharacterized protein n=1 Tax=Helianthus annuus TaxID=4232 RepID=A0A251UUP8_HELAN
MSFQCAKNEHTDVSPLADYPIKDCGKAGCVYDDVDNQYCWCGITKTPECCYVHQEDCDWALKHRQLRPKSKQTVLFGTFGHSRGGYMKK